MPDPVVASQPSGSMPVQEAERRKFVRFAVVTPAHTKFLAQPGFQFGDGLLKDVSVSGFSLILNQPLRTDARLIVQLPRRRRGRSLARTARVLRVEADGPGRWLVGCQLCWPLSDEEIGALRAGCQTPA